MCSDCAGWTLLIGSSIFGCFGVPLMILLAGGIVRP